MAAFKVFQCTGYEDGSIPESVLGKFSGTYEEISRDPSLLAELALALKDHYGKSYCELPLGHTMEAEGYGAVPVFDPLNGNRIPKPLLSELSRFEELPRLDVSKGRLASVLTAVSLLKQAGEPVVLNVSGPVSLGTSLLDSRVFYKALRKNSQELQSFLRILEEGITTFALAGVARGVDVISMADPAGSMDILGPEVYRNTAGSAMHRILKKLEEGNALVHLCGRTSTSLEAAGFLETRVIKADGADYFTMLQSARAEGLAIAGHWCLKSGKRDTWITECILRG